MGQRPCRVRRDSWWGRGFRRPQTKVAWCGLALGLAGPPATGLRLGTSDVRAPLARDLWGPVRTLGTLLPRPGATPATRSTSMMVLTGRPWLPLAPPPVTRKERLSPSALPWALQPCKHPTLVIQIQVIRDLGALGWSAPQHSCFQSADLQLHEAKAPRPSSPQGQPEQRGTLTEVPHSEGGPAKGALGTSHRGGCKRREQR